MIHLDQVTLRRGHSILFEQASCQIHQGHHLGLVGVNGCGKSSFLGLLLGQLEADLGEVSLPDWQTAHVAQEVASGEMAAIDYVLDGDSELRRLETVISRHSSDPDNTHDNALHQALAGMEAIDGYTARSRAARILHGLGFREQEMTHPVNAFSGGWRIRLNLARALISRSDMLLLDEPTNHLDLPAVIWLENWLSRYAGTLIVISHDREFLDKICQGILAIEGKRLNSYRGNYSDYERLRAEKALQQEAARRRQEKQVAHLQSYVDRFRAKASKARQAQSRLKMIARLAEIAPAYAASGFTFSFRVPERVPDHLLQLDAADLGYESPLLRGIDFSIKAGDRIGLLGANGTGKSTLIKTLANGSTLLAGHRTINRHTRIGYFAQHQLEQLDTALSPVQQMTGLDSRLTEQQIRDYLGTFGFSGDRIFDPVTQFSGGEKARLVLAMIIHQAPNLLLLDEPTNHLDLDMRVAVTLALQSFTGALILISHDRHMMNSICDELYLVQGDRIELWKEDLDRYARLLKEASREDLDTDPSGNSEREAPRQNRRQLRQQQAERRQALKPLRDRVNGLEKRISEVECELERVSAQLADPDLYAGNSGSDDIASLMKQQSQCRDDLAELEHDWLHASEELESQMTGDPETPSLS